MHHEQGWFTRRLAGWLLAVAIFLASVSAIAQAQAVTRVRGAITGFDGQVLSVKTRDGDDMNITVTEDTGISSIIELRMNDIRQGDFVGVTSINKGQDGTRYALEVHVFPEPSRGSGEGHRDWDLEPGSTMTNANIDAIVERNDGKELTLGYKGGMQKIIMLPEVPVVSFMPGDKSLLNAGMQIFIIAHQAGDGAITAQRILVGKGGIKPPM